MLTAGDALARELELDRGGFTAADRDVLDLGQGTAVANDFRTHGVDIGRADFEVRRDQGAMLGRGVGRGAIHDQTGVGRQADDNRRGSGGADFALRPRQGLALGHIFLQDGDNDGAAGAAVAAGATVAAGAAVVAMMTVEETAAVAAVAGGAAVAAGATVAAGAAVATIAEQTMTLMAAAGATDIARASRDDGGTTGRATVTTIAAEIGRFTAGRQGQHQHC